MISHSLWLVLWQLIWLCHSQNYDLCDGEYECYNSTIIHSSSDASIECFGYYSCGYTDVTIDTIRCYAADACKHSQTTRISSLIDSETDCRAYGGCNRVIVTNLASDTYWCGGELSCSNVKNVGGFSSQPQVLCWGTGSCMNGQFGEYNFFQAMAAYSLSNATLDGYVYGVYFYGYNAGFNTKIICHSGDYCGISCKYNACNRTYMICHDSASCSVECDESNGDLCPIWVDYDSYIANNGDIGLTTGVMDVYDEYSELLVDYYGISNDICNNIDNWSGGGSDSLVVCDDYQSCRFLDITVSDAWVDSSVSSIGATIGAAICCRGSQSCQGSVGSGSLVNMALNGTIECLGSYSCASIDNIAIQSGGTLNCLAVSSCHSSKIIANWGTVNCRAENGCSGATIYNASVIHCDGYVSCWAEMTVVGVNTLYVRGCDAIVSSHISSGGAGISMTIYFECYSLNSYSYDPPYITCDEGDTCTFYCFSTCCSETTLECNGNCYTYCDEEIGNSCFYKIFGTGTNTMIDPTQTPTNMPTIPTIIPTIIPTSIPTTVPTVFPTSGPSSSLIQTTTTTHAPFGTNSTNSTNSATNDTNPTHVHMPDATVSSINNHNKHGSISEQEESIIQQWEASGYICLLLTFICPLIIIAFGWRYHNNKRIKNAADSPDYLAIFQCFWNIGDFYSDIIFGFMLLFINDNLAYFAIFFSIAPHIVNNILCLHWMRKWRTYNIYLSRYVNRYDWFLISVSVCGGFYAAMEIARCRLFYLRIFGLQLKQTERSKLKFYRFLNVVICEDLAQVIIQFMYLMKSDNNLNFIVFNAMLFSCFSLFIGILNEVMRRIKENSDFYVRYAYRKKKIYKMVIECSEIQSYHQFTHKKIQKILSQTLDIEQENVETYYIFLKRHGIVCYVEINTFYNNNTHTTRTLTQNELNTVPTRETSPNVAGQVPPEHREGVEMTGLKLDTTATDVSGGAGGNASSSEEVDMAGIGADMTTRSRHDAGSTRSRARTVEEMYDNLFAKVLEIGNNKSKMNEIATELMVEHFGFKYGENQLKILIEETKNELEYDKQTETIVVN